MRKELELMKLAVIKWNDCCRATPPSIEEQTAIVNEEVQELQDAILAGDFVEELDALADIFFTGVYLDHINNTEDNSVWGHCEDLLNQGIESHSFSLVLACIDEVIKSNYTKVVNINDLEEWEEFCFKQSAKLSSEKNMKVWYNIVLLGEDLREGRVAVFLDENNKVCKPVTYLAPDLPSIIEEYLQGGNL